MGVGFGFRAVAERARLDHFLGLYSVFLQQATAAVVQTQKYTGNSPTRFWHLDTVG